jgi:hypothetical protein
MGYASVLDFRIQAGDDAALEYHLQHNHFPPVHPVFIPVAKEAIEKARFEEWDDQLVLPNERVLSVADIIRQLHLDAFLDDLSEGC